jgi:hypothetical protein
MTLRSSTIFLLVIGCGGKNLLINFHYSFESSLDPIQIPILLLYEGVFALMKPVHCLSKLLVSKYDLIVFEDLKIKNLVKNSKLAKSIHDAGMLMQQSIY